MGYILEPLRWGHTPPSLADSAFPHTGIDTHRETLHRAASASGILGNQTEAQGGSGSG